MKILLINHYAGSPSLGMEFRPYYLASEWVKLGHEVTILAADYSHLRITQPNGKGIRHEIVDGVKYIWLPTLPYQGNGISRVRNMFTFLYQGFKYLSGCRGGFNQIIASSTYPLDILLAKYVAKGNPVTFELHDIWPLTLTNIGKMPKFHPFVLLMSLGEYLTYKWCDQVVSILSNSYSHVQTFEINSADYMYIPNGVPSCESSYGNTEPSAEFVRREIRTLKKTFSLIAGYVGGHALSNNLETIIDAAKKEPQVAFVFVGKGVEKARLIELCKDIENIFFFDAVKKNSVPSVLSEIDVLLISWADESLYKFGTGANKVFDYMLAGKPVIQAISSPNSPVDNASAGYTVPPNDSDAIADVLRRMKVLDKSTLETMGARGRHYITENHLYPNLAKKYIDFFNRKITLNLDNGN